MITEKEYSIEDCALELDRMGIRPMQVSNTIWLLSPAHLCMVQDSEEDMELLERLTASLE